MWYWSWRFDHKPWTLEDPRWAPQCKSQASVSISKIRKNGEKRLTLERIVRVLLNWMYGTRDNRIITLLVKGWILAFQQEKKYSWIGLIITPAIETTRRAEAIRLRNLMYSLAGRYRGATNRLAHWVRFNAMSSGKNTLEWSESMLIPRNFRHWQGSGEDSVPFTVNPGFAKIEIVIWTNCRRIIKLKTLTRQSSR